MSFFSQRKFFRMTLNIQKDLPSAESKGKLRANCEGLKPKIKDIYLKTILILFTFINHNYPKKHLQICKINKNI